MVQQRSGRIGTGRRVRRYHRPGHAADGAHPHVDDFQGYGRVGIVVGLPVGLVKDRRRIVAKGYRQFIRLALVADVQHRFATHPLGRDPFAGKVAHAACDERVQLLGQDRGGRVAGQHHRLAIVQHHIGHQHAQRGKGGGIGRDEHARDAELASQIGRVQAAGAAKRDQAKVLRVVPALHRDDAQGALHVGIDHRDDAQRTGLR